MEKLNVCPLCGSSKIDFFLASKDYFLTMEEFSIDNCLSCEAKFTNPRPKGTEILKYYNSKEYISHSEAPKTLIDRIYYIIRKYAIASKVRLVKKYVQSGNVIDIGCGTGQFLNELKIQDFNVTGIEPNETARGIAIKNFGLTVYNEEMIDEMNEGSFQIISLWHALEHVEDLDRRIIQLRKLLSPDGVVIVAVPNPDSWDAKHYNNFWAAFDLPRHLYHFNFAAIQNVFSKFGFKIIERRPLYFDAFYICLLSEKYKNGKLTMIKAFLKGLISNFSALFNKNNYSSVIYVLGKK
ncbi:MAG: class I SAM-dependent methyltransferase [Bacteroidales bacterium]